MTLTDQEQFWAAEFGTEYTKRNRPAWEDRSPFWESIMQRTGAQSALEVGCNVGTNLMAIANVVPGVSLKGIDVCDSALDVARAVGHDVETMSGALAGRKWPGAFDLVFTAGMLIHVAPENLDEVAQSIIDASNSWVLAVEYASESGEEEALTYRGHADKMWKRDFGKLYQDKGLTLVSTGKADGFDRCVWWLLSK